MNMLKIVLSTIFVIFIQILGISILLQENLFKYINLNNETNDFCQTKVNASNNSLDYLICNNKFKKEKIILLLIDSLSYDSLHDFNYLKDYNMTNFFRGEGIEYKQSGALFETIFSGKFNRNYLASKVMKMDNLAQQFKNANMNITYYIKPFPLGNLIDKKLGDDFENCSKEYVPLSNFCNTNFNPFIEFIKDFEKFIIKYENKKIKKEIFQDILYDKANKKLKYEYQKIRSQLNLCFAEKNFNSIVFFSDTLDHIIHTKYRHHPIPLFAVYYIENMIKEIIKWINEEHSEFALVVASDHGGQLYYGEDTICNHGCNSEGNEGIFFVYSKELAENYEKYKTNFEKENIPLISLNDFPCTISQILKNINLPLESTCIPRLIGNDKLLRFANVKSKEIQLIQFIEKLTKKYPALSNQYHSKYDKMLKDNKYSKYFKNKDTIDLVDEKFYDDYMDYLIDIQIQINRDVIKSSQNYIYYLIYYIALIIFIISFFYCIRKLVLITREKIFKELNKNQKNKNPILNKIVRLIIILLFIILVGPLFCLIFHNTKNISKIINISIFIKYFGFLILLFFVFLLNNLKTNLKYKKLIIILTSIILIHFIMTKISFFRSLDKFIDSKYRNNFLNYYFYYPLFLIYICFELFSYRNYYLTYKYNIKYIYFLIPYLIYLLYFIIKFDFFYLRQQTSGHPPEIIFLLEKIYVMICLLLLFIKSFKEKNNERKKVLSSEIINFKFFFIIMINFICVEVERFEMILLFHFILFYLSKEFRKEKDLFLKILYLIIIICYPQIHFIGNQGAYTMDTSIKVTIKCPSHWADDRPIVMGFIFVADKYRFNIICIGYLFSFIKITKKKIMNYYTEFILLIHYIQLFAIILCFLFYLKKELGHYFIQILYLISVQIMPIILFQLAFLINYIFYKIINLFASKVEYKPLN